MTFEIARDFSWLVEIVLSCFDMSRKRLKRAIYEGFFSKISILQTTDRSIDFACWPAIQMESYGCTLDLEDLWLSYEKLFLRFWKIAHYAPSLLAFRRITVPWYIHVCSTNLCTSLVSTKPWCERKILQEMSVQSSPSIAALLNFFLASSIIYVIRDFSLGVILRGCLGRIRQLVWGTHHEPLVCWQYSHTRHSQTSGSQWAVFHLTYVLVIPDQEHEHTSFWMLQPNRCRRDWFHAPVFVIVSVQQRRKPHRSLPFSVSCTLQQKEWIYRVDRKWVYSRR